MPQQRNVQHCRIEELSSSIRASLVEDAQDRRDELMLRALSDGVGDIPQRWRQTVQTLVSRERPSSLKA